MIHDKDTVMQEKPSHVEQTEPVGSYYIDPEKEKKLVRKIDWHLIPILCVLLVCAFVDR